MARRRRRGRGHRWLLPLVVLAAAVACAAVYLHDRQRVAPAIPPTPPPAEAAGIEVVAERIDPRNDGRRVRVVGQLHAAVPVRDPQFGVGADALALERTVEMLQWIEECSGADCRYRLDWVDRPVDSQAFKQPRGHENAASFPFRSQQFVTATAMLGAFVVGPRVIDGVGARVPHPVHVADLPPNLAASLRECDGRLCSGDAKHAAAGDLRIAWRIVPDTRMELAGLQRGNRLEIAH